MGERRGTKALELWCRRITDGYPDVNVQNMTTSWRDGLAFCAMIHHFRPDLIDFSSLNKSDVYRNNELAFRIAEEHLGIPALLDAEDMASCTVPDRLSILTYLSQFYQTFGGSSPSHLTTNRRTETANERIAPIPESPKPSVKVMSRLGVRRDPCAVCRLPVFLAEKLVIARVPYHRTCFRCARCDNQLMPGNYYETEEGQYCCEACPDERASVDARHHRCVESTDVEREQNEPLRSLSDEEKTEKKTVRNLLENAAVPDLISHTSQMRKNFMAGHLLSERIDESITRDTSTKTVDIRNDFDQEKAKWKIDSAFPDDDENEERKDDFCNSTTDYLDTRESNERCDVHNAFSSLNIKSDENQRSTILFRGVNKSRKDDTKESPEHDDESTNSVYSDGTGVLSVKQRLQMFETGDIMNRADRKNRDNISRMTETKGGSPAVQNTTVTQCDSCDPALDILRANDEECSQERLEEYSKIKSTESSANIDVQQNADNSIIVNIDENKDTFLNDLAWMNNEEHIDNKQPENNLTVRNIEGQKEEGFVKNEDELRKNNRTHKKTFEIAANGGLPATKDIDSDTENYPEDLNPFNSDEEDSVMEDKQQIITDTSENKEMSTNPFDIDEDVEETKLPKPAVRSIPENCETMTEAPIKRLLVAPQINLNPFWSDEDVEEVEVPKPAIRSRLENCGAVTEALSKRLLTAPQINLNPFSSDEEEKRDNYLESRNGTLQEHMPVPKPRTTKTIPAISTARKAELNCENIYASNSSITSSESVTTSTETYKKKKPAPQPPAANESFLSYQYTSSVSKSCDSSSSLCQSSSPCTTPRPRKTKPAPPPPMLTSTPRNMSINSVLNAEDPLIIDLGDDHDLSMWQDQKISKDEANRNRQSLSDVSFADDGSYKFHTDKSVHGKWKRKKGPAPPLPIPHRRKIKVISMKDVKLELDEIELQQQGLERQGVRLEQLIRDKCESKPRTDSLLDTDVEELILELFALVNEKNELFRRQAELMLLRRQQRLEEEHAEIEYQIRCLMYQPKTIKTDFDKQREELLIQRLVDIVERRNEIVECLEMDRRREIEEDKSINQRMGLFAARSKNELLSNGKDSSNVEETKKKSKTKEKQKQKKFKKTTKKDADKDVDESEIKRHNKRKWF